jgi:GMC oxidoreductase
MKTAVLAALLVSLNFSLNIHGHALHFTQHSRRSTISTDPAVLDGTLRIIGPYNTADIRNLLGKAFDFVIVGGGAAGLTLANRLSEATNRTVAVIEAGDDGSAVMERILVPACKHSFPFIHPFLRC